MEPQRASETRFGWTADVGNRLRTRWPAKGLGTTLGMALFFVLYFQLLRHPWFPVTVVPLTPVDRWIGFHPWALPLYMSLWLYVSLAPALLRNGRELASYGVAAVVLSAVGLAIFLYWPTTVPTTGIDWSQHPGMQFLKSADAGGNACPSLHVAFAVFTGFWFERLLREMRAGRGLRTLNWLWCVGICYSTIAVRQHVFIDVAAGAALGMIVAAAHLRLLDARVRADERAG